MRTLLLASAASASVLVLSTSLGVASPVTSPVPLPTLFGFTSQVVTYTVQDTGTYEIVVSGAQGGTEPFTIAHNATGGDGARIEATFNLDMGEVLRIAVGGRGGNGPTGFDQSGAAGGGGGTFVLGSNNTPLLIAGGGGGGGEGAGYDGRTPSDVGAQNGNGSGGGSAGSAGSGGSGGTFSETPVDGGGGGGGFIGNGTDGSGSSSSSGKGGMSFANGLGGGGSGQVGGGGFGGGGGGGGGGLYGFGGGGGGGGYSGGGGGGEQTSSNGGGDGGEGGGGGGSFISDSAIFSSFMRAPDGDGSVAIVEFSKSDSPASVPEPAGLALFGTVLAGLGLIQRHRRG